MANLTIYTPLSSNNSLLFRARGTLNPAWWIFPALRHYIIARLDWPVYTAGHGPHSLDNQSVRYMKIFTRYV